MAGLYCDITLLARVGKETATNTISRQAILYSSSGLMFSAQTHEDRDIRRKDERLPDKVCVCVFVSYRSFVRTEPPPGPGRSHRVNLPPTTARRHSWPPGDRRFTINARKHVFKTFDLEVNPFLNIC